MPFLVVLPEVVTTSTLVILVISPVYCYDLAPATVTPEEPVREGVRLAMAYHLPFPSPAHDSEFVCRIEDQFAIGIVHGDGLRVGRE